MLIVLAVAMVVRIAALAVIPPETKPWSDGAQYVNLASSLASGRGFVLEEGNWWPGAPTIVRAPGVPLILSVPIRFVSYGMRWRAARITCVLFDSLNAVLMLILARSMGARPLTAAIAGVMYAVNPVAAGLCAYPASEPIGITFLLLFVLSTGDTGDLRRIGKAALIGILLGVGCLIRANWGLTAFLFGAGMLWSARKNLRRVLPWLAVMTAVTLAMLAPWVARNAGLFHHFPILGAGGGEVFCGGNNDIAAQFGGDHWGRLVYPHRLPGMTQTFELAWTLNEYEVDRFHMKAGWEWIRTNPGKVPVLVLGKLYRSYVPVPRSRGPDVLTASAFRWLVYVLAFVGIRRRLKEGWRPSGTAMVALAAIGVAQLVSVVVFAGEFRFVFPAEVFLALPAAGVVASSLITGKVGHLLLRSIAWLVLEPRFLSGGWQIRRRAVEPLRPWLAEIETALGRAEKLFEGSSVCIGACCCDGQYSRFTVYDHISHMIKGASEEYPWDHRLRPFSRWQPDQIDDERWCPYLVEGKGCRLDYPARPAVCVFHVCRRLADTMTLEQQRGLRGIRSEIDRVHWAYALCLLFGGMERKKMAA